MKIKKLTNKKVFYVILCLILLAFSISVVPKSFQNDTFYTIKVGEAITKYGVDMKEHFSFLPVAYTYPHWLYDVMIYGIYHLFGFGGIYVSTILFSFLLALVSFLTLRKVTENDLISFVLSFFLLLCLKNFLAARAQLISYIIFILELYEIEAFLSSKKKRHLIFLLLLAVLLANVHSAVFPFFFVLFLPYFGEALVTKLVEKRKKSKEATIGKIVLKREENIKWLILAFFLCLPMGLLTLNGLSPYTYYLKIAMGDSTSYISEHFPTTIDGSPVFFLILFCLFFLFAFTKCKLRLKDFFLLLGLTFMAFLSRRNFALFLVCGILVFGRLLLSIAPKKFSEWSHLFEVSLSIPIIQVGMLILVFFMSMTVTYFETKDQKYVTSSYPVKLADYIIENIDYKNVKFFNEYNYGSYLLYRGIPVFIDSRCDLYLKEFNGKDDYVLDAWNLPEDYETVFTKYDFDYIITTKESDLNSWLKKDQNYLTVTKQGQFVLYQRLK